MKAKIGWIRFDSDYNQWEFSPTEPESLGGSSWQRIVYFDVED